MVRGVVQRQAACVAVSFEGNCGNSAVEERSVSMAGLSRALSFRWWAGRCAGEASGEFSQLSPACEAATASAINNSDAVRLLNVSEQPDGFRAAGRRLY